MTKFLFFGFIFVFNSLTIQAAQFDWGGEFNLFTKVTSKPTSKRGQVSFILPSTLLNVDAQADEKNSVFLELQLSANRDNLNRKFQTELTKLFYQWVSEENDFFIRYGLFRNFISENETEFYDFDFFDELKTVSRRFNYLPNSDLGLEVHYLFSSYLSVGMGVANGEENRKEEDGTQKDAYVVMDYADEDFNFGVMYLKGAYDEYEKPFNEKERSILKISWNFGLIKIGAEGLVAKDAATGISDYKRADGWDSTQFPEQVIQGQGYSVWLRLGVNEEDALVLKGDYFDPNKEQKDDEINSHQVLLDLKRKQRHLFFGYTFTSYGEKHSNYSPEKEFGFVGIRQIF